ncbi:MAG: TraR/DksA C4-type zinc finger protein [Actinomycetota bacterium]|nr:TraR/DksA C4-type zinc finger protein [Actinomycetota bacterium]
MTAAPMLTSRDRRALRTHVLQELVQLEGQIASLARSFDDIVAAAEQSNVDDEHDPEGTTIAFERQQVAALLRQARLDHEALRATLDRIEQPGYGVCEHCRGFIGVERLLALPATTRCIACAS